MKSSKKLFPNEIDNAWLLPREYFHLILSTVSVSLLRFVYRACSQGYYHISLCITFPVISDKWQGFCHENVSMFSDAGNLSRLFKGIVMRQTKKK